MTVLTELTNFNMSSTFLSTMPKLKHVNKYNG